MHELALIDLIDVLRMLMAAFGIGLVIFVHEAGHFFAARMCGVRVETFSLGFGPRILAWKRGATVYQIAAVPLGGYVKMAGEEGTLPGEPPAPDELPAKSVGQRFLIYSGGVVMNVVFSLIAFPIVLSAGVPFDEPLIGTVEPGGAAWEAGVVPGSRVLAIDGESAYSFESILQAAVLADEEEGALFDLEEPDGTRRSLVLHPRYNEDFGYPSIDVGGGHDRNGAILVAPDSAAYDAGLSEEDRLIAIVGGLEGLTLWEQYLGALRDGAPVRVEVEREGVRRIVEIEPRLIDAQPQRPVLGVEPATHLVRALRPNSDTVALGIAVGDTLLRLDEFPLGRRHALRRALLAGVGQPHTLHVERDGQRLELALAALDRTRALALADAIALEQDTDATTVVLAPDAAARLAGMRDGDRIVRVGEEPVQDWSGIVAETGRQASLDATLSISVVRSSPDGAREFLDLRVRPAPSQLRDFGFVPQRATYIYRAESFGEAVRVGMQSSWRFMTDTWHTLKGMLFGRVSSEHMGGIIMIGQASYSWAAMGLPKLFFFLCILRPEPGLPQRAPDPRARRRTPLLPGRREAQGIAGIGARAGLQPDGRSGPDPVVDDLRDVQRHPATAVRPRSSRASASRVPPHRSER